MHASELPPDALTVVTAQTQTQGRGRRGRSWHAPPTGNLALTCFFVLTSYNELEHIGQVMALSIIEALLPCRLPIKLKLPNDLRIREKKMGGILCETVPLAEKSIGILVGVGLNVNASADFLAGLDQPATSLLVELGCEQDLVQIQNALLSAFNQNLSQFEQRGFAPFAETLGDRLE